MATSIKADLRQDVRPPLSLPTPPPTPPVPPRPFSSTFKSPASPRRSSTSPRRSSVSGRTSSDSPTRPSASPQWAASLEVLQDNADLPPETLPSERVMVGPVITMYIFRVPGTQDFCLSLVKPLRGTVTELDILFALYYVRIGVEDTMIILRRGRPVARMIGNTAEMFGAGYHQFHMRHTNDDKPVYGQTFHVDAKGLTSWQSPWRGHCVFEPTKTRQKLNCEHYRNDASIGATSSTISTLKFNIPGFSSDELKRKSKLFENRKSIRDILGAEFGPKEERNENSILPPRPQSFYQPYEYAPQMRGLPPKLPPRSQPPQPLPQPFEHASHATGLPPKLPPRSPPPQSSSEPFEFTSPSTGLPPKLPPRSSFSSQAENVKPPSLPPPLPPRAMTIPAVPTFPNLPADKAPDKASNVGQEKLGGGFRGKTAKLGTLKIWGGGQQMLDMIVAANTYMFLKTYKVARPALLETSRNFDAVVP